MLAIDTDVIVRHLTGDDPEQAARARALIERTARALNWLERGMDFADALHLTKADDCEAFVSFDRRLAAAADRLGAPRVCVPF
jgi:predicted nucleic acid-binding protein